MMTNQKECARCISDTSIPDIRVDEHGVCNYCKTVTCDWAEYKALQLSFFKASVPDAEIANRFLRVG